MVFFLICLYSNHSQLFLCFLSLPGEGVGDPAGGGEESEVSGRVVQEAAGSRTAGSRGPGGEFQPWKRGGREAAAEAAGKTEIFPHVNNDFLYLSMASFKKMYMKH